MDFPKLEPGSTIAGRYELIDKLGAGAFGAVYRARQLGIDRHVALKVLLPDAESVDSTAVARFQREAKLSSSLEHPNTITVHDYGEWNGMLYLVMEYVRGESLRAILRKEGRMEPQRAVRITRQILASLQEAHARGIIHRDMKPANIMLFDRVGESDVVKVLDFGIAKFISNDAAVSNTEVAEKDLTVAGRIVGTPRYMAPEQIRGTGPSPRSDIYAMGLMFFEMLVGERAVAGDSTISLIAAQLSDEPVVQPSDPRIPPQLGPIISRATHKNPNERYTNAAEFIQALDESTNALARGARLPPFDVVGDADTVSVDLPGPDTRAELTPLPPPKTRAGLFIVAAAVLGVAALGMGTIGYAVFGPNDNGQPTVATPTGKASTASTAPVDPACTSNAQCPSDRMCREGVCVEPPPPIETATPDIEVQAEGETNDPVVNVKDEPASDPVVEEQTDSSVVTKAGGKKKKKSKSKSTSKKTKNEYKPF